MTALAVPTMQFRAVPATAMEQIKKHERILAALPQVGIETDHLIHADMYARTALIPAGTDLVGALMRIPTVLIFHGHAMVTTGSDVVEIKGYGVLPGSAGRKQVFRAIEDTILTMLFHTSAKTVAEAEAEFTDEHERLMSRQQPEFQTIRITGE